MGLKISELPSVSSVQSGDELILNYEYSGSYNTGRITASDLFAGYVGLSYSGSDYETNYELDGYLDQYLSESAQNGILSSYLSVYYLNGSYHAGSDLDSYLEQEGYLKIESAYGSYSEPTGRLDAYLSQQGYISDSSGGDVVTIGGSAGGPWTVTGNLDYYLSDYLREGYFLQLFESGGYYYPYGAFESYIQQEDFVAASQFEYAMSDYLASHASEIYTAIQPYLNS